MEIRDARPDDAEAILAVHRASIEGLGPSGYDEAQVEAWRRGRSPDDYDLDAERKDFVVAEDDSSGDDESGDGESVVGFGSVSSEPGEHLDATVDGEITGLYVHPDVARKGVGSAILSTLEERAQEWGCRSLGLWASLSAVEFYESHGYERVTDHTIEFDDGVEGRVVEMRRKFQ